MWIHRKLCQYTTMCENKVLIEDILIESLSMRFPKGRWYCQIVKIINLRYVWIYIFRISLWWFLDLALDNFHWIQTQFHRRLRIKSEISKANKVKINISAIWRQRWSVQYSTTNFNTSNLDFHNVKHLSLQ